MKKEDFKNVADEEWVDSNLIDFMESELNQEDMRRTLMALETTPKLRDRLNDYMLIKAALRSEQHINRLKRDEKRNEASLESLHNRIMMQIETQEIQKKK